MSQSVGASPVQFGFVAALEREVAGLVRGWSVADARIGNRPGRIYYSGCAALICAGTGVERGYAAAKELVEKFSPRVIISIGFAGSCAAELAPGTIVVPATLEEASTRKLFHCLFGSGKVVTLDRVAGKAMKQEAALQFGALAVDMEGAGVASAAEEFAREFSAIKVISDGADEDLGFLADFVKADGFETGRFVAHIALRPYLWPAVAALQRNSKLASAALESAVAECLSDWRGFTAKYSSAAQLR